MKRRCKEFQDEVLHLLERLDDDVEVEDPNEAIIHVGEEIVALARRSANVACGACMGRGERLYGSTATWRGYLVGGAQMTRDICDQCWGTGRNDKIGVNLREIRKPR